MKGSFSKDDALNSVRRGKAWCLFWCPLSVC